MSSESQSLYLCCVRGALKGGLSPADVRQMLTAGNGSSAGGARPLGRVDEEELDAEFGPKRPADSKKARPKSITKALPKELRLPVE